MKTSREFEAFKKEFTRYQKMLGLTGYNIYFRHEPIGNDCFANITANYKDCVATVRLNSKLLAKDRADRPVRLTAKHEALHLLLNKIESLADSRYIREDEVTKSIEELVVKLEGLIP